MGVLTTTLRSVLEQAEAHFHDGRIQAARQAAEELVERAQERADARVEAAARVLLARCLLLRRDTDGARAHLEAAERRLEPSDRGGHRRHRAALARLRAAEEPGQSRQAWLDYLAWAEDAAEPEGVVDACLLLSQDVPLTERIRWLQRAVEHGSAHEITHRMGSACNDLAAALDQSGEPEEAYEHYRHALAWHRRGGSNRQVVGATWAVGVAAARLGEWPEARGQLEEAIAAAEALEDCADLLALALADLARVEEAAGDVIEARRLLIRAIGLGREQDLPRLWPERWAAIRRYAKALELEA